MNDLSKIPSVHALLNDPEIRAQLPLFSDDFVRGVIRSVLSGVRSEIRHSEPKSHVAGARNLDTIKIRILSELSAQHSFRRVINATGVLIHTNLGRAPLSEKALKKGLEIGKGYCTIEYDLRGGKRGERNDPIERLLCQITGAEAAVVVNNNACALLLCLNTLANGKSVLVSRGELVEIGNSFRVPEIMEKSGALLKEVGTTNKTKAKDYEKGIDQNTSTILKVHKSNYDIVGFTEEVPLKELISIARKGFKRQRLPLLFDAGSGLLLPISHPLFHYFSEEPSIISSVKWGVDLITFSGDKLMGGPQCGVVVGKKKYVQKLKRNPLYRALRLDKIVIALLEETLRSYLFRQPENDIPFLKLLGTNIEILEERARQIQGLLKEQGIASEVRRNISKIGGGSCPREGIDTMVLAIPLPRKKLLEVEQKMRIPEDSSLIPVIGRIQKETLILDFRTIFENDLVELGKNLKQSTPYT